MAELTQGERLQPSLLDRLKDDYPQRRKERFVEPGPGGEAQSTSASEGLPESDASDQVEGSPSTRSDESPRARDTSQVINSRELKKCVQRDLAWLLNSGCLADAQDLSPYPNVAESVLNYGIPDLTGLVASTLDTQILERKLAAIITRFEPRILKRTLRIRVSTSEQMSGNALKFEIECDVWGQPTPERMYLHSEIDLEGGMFHFREHIS